MSLFPVHYRRNARDGLPRFDEKMGPDVARWPGRQSSPYRRWQRRIKPLIRLLGILVLAIAVGTFIFTVSFKTNLGTEAESQSFIKPSGTSDNVQVSGDSGPEGGSLDVIERLALHSNLLTKKGAPIDTIKDTTEIPPHPGETESDEEITNPVLSEAHGEATQDSTDQSSSTEDQATMPAADRDQLEAVMDSSQVRLGVISSPEAPAKERPLENESADHLSLEDLAENLPDFVYIPFEDAVNDERLEGWEDEWISSATYRSDIHGTLSDSSIDFIYLWVNGSEQAFQGTKHPYELKSVLNDAAGTWINSHGVNRYRDWNELKYSFRSIETNAGLFRNNIQVLVNSLTDGDDIRSQTPSWLDPAQVKEQKVQVLSQEEYFDKSRRTCLPTFNSLTMENQIFNTVSNVDEMFTMSDDMLLTKEHAASDIHTPLFGPVMSFKTNAYNTKVAPTEVDAARFGEKPYLIYTSWLLNRRFGMRKRKGQSHFGHSLSRKVMKEAIEAFPGPEIRSACKRFRGEPGFQLYSWYAAYHYLIERHREALLWSYIIKRSDENADGMLLWDERQSILSDLEAGMRNVKKTAFRKRNFYHLPAALEKAGLTTPKVHTNTLWTSLDGPIAVQTAECEDFDVNECLAPGFSIATPESKGLNPAFSSALIFDRLARQKPECGDCLIKILLSQQSKGLEPLLPPKSRPEDREMAVKALMRYKYSIVDPQNTLFAMVTDADQVDSTLTRTFVREKKPLPGQMCLNDDVEADDPQELQEVFEAMSELFEGLFPLKSKMEL